jgi:hypothetical protein
MIVPWRRHNLLLLKVLADKLSDFSNPLELSMSSKFRHKLSILDVVASIAIVLWFLVSMLGLILIRIGNLLFQERTTAPPDPAKTVRQAGSDSSLRPR